MTLSKKATIAFRLALAVTVIAVMYLATTNVQYPVAEDLNDKVSHILAFFVLSFLLDFSFPERIFNLKPATALVGFGLLIEFIQYFIPYRSCSLLDLAADAIGIALYWTTLLMVRRILFQTRRQGIVGE